jgi:hypothetical protein
MVKRKAKGRSRDPSQNSRRVKDWKTQPRLAGVGAKKEEAMHRQGCLASGCLPVGVAFVTSWAIVIAVAWGIGRLFGWW